MIVVNLFITRLDLGQLIMGLKIIAGLRMG
jgi:hypothetical protein